MTSYTSQNIIEKIDDFKSNRGTNLSQKTITEYKKKFTRLNDIEPEIIQKLVDAKSDKKIVNGIINKIKKSFKNVKDYFSVLSKVINNYNDLSDNISDYVKNRIKQVIKEEFVRNLEEVDEKVQFDQVKIQWNDYINFADKTSRDKTVPLKNRIMFSLYKELPLRDDFGNVLLVNEDILDDSINYYNKNTKVLHLNKYKTIEKFGPKKYKIPTYIADMINQQVGARYMIGNTPFKAYAGGNLSSPFKYAMKKYYGESISINDIRHSVITYYNETKTIKKQRQLADIMLHSYQTQSEIYKRK